MVIYINRIFKYCWKVEFEFKSIFNELNGIIIEKDRKRKIEKIWEECIN